MGNNPAAGACGEICNGVDAAPGEAGNGGAIYNDGTLTVSDCIISDSRAGVGGNGQGGGSLFGNGGAGSSGGNGGGMFNAGTLTVSGSTFAGDTAGRGGVGGAAGLFGAGGLGGNGGSGGAIYNQGTLTVSGTTVSGDAAGTGGNGGLSGVEGGGNGGNGGNGGTGGAGGGLSNNGALAVSNSAVAANAAGPGGRGGDAGFVNLFGSGGSGGAGGSGGGLYESESHQLTVSNATISANAVGEGGPAGTSGLEGPAVPAAPAGTGGGTYNAGSATFTAVILADQPAVNCSGTAVTDGAYNVADDSSCGFGGPGEGVADAAIGLGPLHDNGGSSETQAIPTTSVAASIELTGCPPTDQRGFIRPLGNCSAGSYQVTLTASPLAHFDHAQCGAHDGGNEHHHRRQWLPDRRHSHGRKGQWRGSGHQRRRRFVDQDHRNDPGVSARQLLRVCDSGWRHSQRGHRRLRVRLRGDHGGLGQPEQRPNDRGYQHHTHR